MRDYLFHAYNVNTKAIRSYIPPMRVERRIRVSKPAQRRRFRPRGIKKMTVELEKPFVWPSEPKDYGPWDRARWRESMGKPENKEQEVRQKNVKVIKRSRVKSHESSEVESRSQLRRLAEDLLSGKRKWGNVDPNLIPQDSHHISLPHR